MVKIFIVFIFALLTVFSVSSCRPEVKVEPLKFTKARPIKSANFGNPEACGACHEEIYNQWKGSMHNKSYKDPIFLKVYEIASKEGGELIGKFCISCHSPIGILSEEIPPSDGSKLSEIAKKGVQCDLCHTVSGSNGIGNMALVSSPGITKRGPLKDSVSPIHLTAYSELHTKAEFCGMCHNVNHPANNLPLEKTYTEWKEGPYAAQGIQCQDCHMTPGPGVTKPNPGQAAVGAPRRKHIYTHDVAGGNIAIPPILGSNAHGGLAEERLKAAASLEIIPPREIVVRTENTLKVKVTNKGCGHYLPTGLTETRQMWLQIQVSDTKGNKIFSSGDIDDSGKIDPNAVVYHTVVADEDGKPTDKVWFAEKIISDHRVPPKKSVTESYNFAVPANAEYPLIVEAKLRYRSAPQYLIDELFGKGNIVLPIVDMVSARAEIK